MKPLLPFAFAAATLLGACSPAPPQSAGTVATLDSSLDPARARALYFDVIQKLHQDGKSHAALAYLDDFDRRFPADGKARLLRADCLLATGTPAEAEAIYRVLLSGPEAAAAEAGLGQIAASRGDWRQAANAYERAVAAAPIHAAYRNDLGYALLKTGDTERAIFVLRQASELAPADKLIRNNLALALSSQTARP